MTLVDFAQLLDDKYVVPESRFNNQDYIEGRLKSCQTEDVGSLHTTLKYLYVEKGPTNLPKERFNRSMKYLEARELVATRWLRTRTNGNLRKTYGALALKSARSARYRCERCKYPDVRALHLDHVRGRHHRKEFACLCANCHNIKSREKDWTGKPRVV